jgi:hypothetical protein
MHLVHACTMSFIKNYYKAIEVVIKFLVRPTIINLDRSLQERPILLCRSEWRSWLVAATSLTGKGETHTR